METAVILCYDAMKVVDFHIKIFYKEDLILREWMLNVENRGFENTMFCMYFSETEVIVNAKFP